MLEKWFSRYLFTLKVIHRTTILKMKENRILDFPAAKEIIKKLTIYNEQTYSF